MHAFADVDARRTKTQRIHRRQLKQVDAHNLFLLFPRIFTVIISWTAAATRHFDVNDLTDAQVQQYPPSCDTNNIQAGHAVPPAGPFLVRCLNPLPPFVYSPPMGRRLLQPQIRLIPPYAAGRAVLWYVPYLFFRTLTKENNDDDNKNPGATTLHPCRFCLHQYACSGRREIQEHHMELQMQIGCRMQNATSQCGLSRRCCGAASQ